MLLKNDFMELFVDKNSVLAQRGLDGFEPSKVAFFKKHVFEGDVVVDVGASEGFYTVLLSKLVGEDGLVISIEPERNNVNAIGANLDLNNLENVQVCCNALSDSIGFETLYLGSKVGLHSLRSGLPGRNLGETEVLCRTLDDIYYTETHGRKINGVKIDVESWEMRVLYGGKKILSSPYLRYLAIDVHPSLGVNVQDIIDIVLDYGFEIDHVSGQGNELLAVKK